MQGNELLSSNNSAVINSCDNNNTKDNNDNNINNGRNNIFTKDELNYLEMERNNNNNKNNNTNNYNNNKPNDIDMSDQSDDSETAWQKVYPSTSKRMRKEIDNPSKKPTNEYCNRFAVLTQDEEEPKQSIASKSDEVKPPPIIIPNVDNIRDMMKAFNSVIAVSAYTFKCLRDGQIRLMVKDVKSYRSIIKYLDSKKINYHTYQPKTERAFRVVIKNLHHTTPLEDIKTELLENAHDARNIINVRSRISREPLPMFFIDLEPKENNNEIYNLKYINNMVIKVEPPRHFDDLVQCHRCQEFGHTKSFCKKKFRCVKCGLGHPTTECPKPKDMPPQCIHCLQSHTANYKGCKIYQEILNRQKTKPSYNKQYENRRTNNETTISTPQYKNPYIPGQSSYADVTKDNIHQSYGFNDKLETMLAKQIEMMNTIISMMSVLMTKLCN